MQTMDPSDYYDEFPDHYSTVGGIFAAAPSGGSMQSTLSPRQAAQKAIDFFLKKKPSTLIFEGGKWIHLEEFGVTVIEPPCGSFYVCYHDESVRMFRSVTKKSSSITPSPLRTIVDPIRPWLVDLFKSEIPGGKDLLAHERGDNSVMERRNAVARKRRESARVAKQEAAAVQEAAEAAKKTKTKTKPPARKINIMALLDVETSTKRIILETRTHQILIDRSRFLGLLKAAGAEVPKGATLSLVYDDDSAEPLFEENVGEKIRIEWKVSAETEEGS